jgi:carboxyl-terminal processing protease
MIDPMAGKSRGLLIGLVLFLVAAVAALVASVRYQQYVALRNGDGASMRLASTVSLRDLMGSSDAQNQLVTVAVHKLEDDYYKPVDPGALVTGERAEITKLLSEHHIANPRLSGDDPNAVLAYAQSHYASKLGAGGATDLTQTALRGIMDSMNDPYTVYLAPKEIQGLRESLDGGNFGGIGVYIYQLKNGQIVVQPIEDLPAARAGMKPGDVVDTVDGKKTQGLSLDAVEQLIRGQEGSTVTLTTHPFQKSGEHTYSIVREIIHVPTVRAQMLSDGLDYIRLSDFGQTSADEVKKALLAGKAKGAKGYILDLRDNGGGFLDAAVNISSYFVPHGTIVATIDRAGNRDEQDAVGDAIDGLGPLVILVNKYTASASEITAGALQDYHLATLIGTKTFGKGVVQSIYSMPDDGALKITTARYVTPNGRDIQHKGIMPDIVVNQNANDPSLIGTTADKQLDTAKAQLLKVIRLKNN